MKKTALNLLSVSAILATIGFIMDGDVKEPSMLMRFAEFFGMVALIFIILAILYTVSTVIYKSIRTSRA